MGKGFGLGAARPVALRLSDSTLPETAEVALVMVQPNSRVSYSSRVGRKCLMVYQRCPSLPAYTSRYTDKKAQKDGKVELSCRSSRIRLLVEWRDFRSHKDHDASGVRCGQLPNQTFDY